MKYKIEQAVTIVAMHNPAMGRTAWIGHTGVIEQIDKREHEIPYLVNVPEHGRIWVWETDLEAA